ncbi:MAG: NAD(P)-dependent oxidoreductase [Bryobacterales bacterium]|nr:NAD(P)-dependent oxidoreductase [Bryobacterales bacterium]
MRVLVTGHNGYIGCALLPILTRAGHAVVGLDNCMFEDCTMGPDADPVPTLRKDVRDVEPSDLEGFDAIIHLAGISNDPLGDLNPDCTYDINHRASVRLARLAKDVGVSRFLFSSSCSNYGAAGGDTILDEHAAFNPVTAYGRSKVLVEQEVAPLGDENFCPVFLRNATAYGFSARLRGDLVLNNLVGWAHITGKVRLKSDGTPWRPIVHIEDISQAFLALMEAPRDLVYNQAFNVGRTEENYQMRDLAQIVMETVPGSQVTFAEDAGPDKRCYRVNCDKILNAIPAFQPQWTARAGARQLYEAYQAFGLTLADFEGPRFMRIHHVKQLQKDGRLDSSLRWVPVAAMSGR